MSRDHRASFRFSLPEGQDRALLRFGWQSLSVQVLNVSATGFLLACPQISVRKDQLLWLRTAAAWTRVRVVFLKDSGAETHVGVERLDELEEPPELSSGWSPFSWLAPGQAMSGGLGNLTIALCVLAGIVAGTIFLNHEWNVSSSGGPRRHVARSWSSFERDLERAWSEVWTAAGRVVPRSGHGEAPPNPPSSSTARSSQPSPGPSTFGSAKPSIPKPAAAAPDNGSEKK